MPNGKPKFWTDLLLPTNLPFGKRLFLRILQGTRRSRYLINFV